MKINYCYNCFENLGENNTGPCSHCGYDPTGSEGKYPFALPHGSILAGQYITGRVLGQGGFGITYLALDKKLNMKVAIKEFLPDSMAVRTGGSHQVTVYTGQRQENFQYGIERFLEEARVLAKFQGNPNIVGVRSYFEENGTAYFVMDYIEGTSFKEYIQDQGGKVTWQESVRVLVPVMDALGAVHKEGIIHRDVTADNIVLTKDGAVKLLDFGSARYSLGDKSKSLDVVLKAGYAPKEQYIRRGKQGPYTDVYSLAACFYAAITGYLPPEALERMDEDNLVPPSTRGIKLPSGMEDVILKGLEVQPNDRYQSMEEFRAELDAAVREEKPSGETAGPVHGPAYDSTSGTTSDSASGPTAESTVKSDTTDSKVEKTSLVEQIKALPKAVKGGVATAACLVIILAAMAGTGMFSGGRPSVVSEGDGGTTQNGGDIRYTAQEGGIGQADAPSGNTPAEETPPEDGGEGMVGEAIPASDTAAATEEDKVAADKAAADKDAADKDAADKAAADKDAADKDAADKDAADKDAADKDAADKAAAAAEPTSVTNKKCTVKASEECEGTYTGEWKDGKPNGKGTFTHAENKWTYTGGFAAGVLSGHGEVIFADGSKYVGDLKNGSYSGTGTYYYKSGDCYEGSFKNGKKDGYGVYAFASGSRYEGNYSNGKRNGEGTLYKADGTVNKKGTWKDGEFVEPEAPAVAKVTNEPYTMVTSKFSVKGTYTGEWKDGKPNGEGTMTMTQSDERWDKGDTLWSKNWSNGLIEGYGQWRSAVDGAYDGNFSKGLKSGYGKMWFSDGTVYDGQWSGGDFKG